MKFKSITGSKGKAVKDISEWEDVHVAKTSNSDREVRHPSDYFEEMYEHEHENEHINEKGKDVSSFIEDTSTSRTITVDYTEENSKATKEMLDYLRERAPLDARGTKNRPYNELVARYEDNVVSDFKKGLPTRSISDKYDISQGMVYTIIDKNRLHNDRPVIRRIQNLSPTTVNNIIKDYVAKMPTKQIMGFYGINKNTLYVLLDYYNIPR